MKTVDFSTLPLLTGSLALVAVTATVWASLAGWVAKREHHARRLKNHAAPVSEGGRRKPLSDDEIRRRAGAVQARRRQTSGPSIRIRLLRAGLNWPSWMILPVVTGLATVLGTVAHLGGLSPTAAGLFGLATGPAAFMLFLRFRYAQRVKAMERDFPAAIDIIVRGVKSGLSLVDCLKIVAREIADPLRSEFALMVEQQDHGVPVSEAVDRLADRVLLSEANFFAIVVGLQVKTGGRLAESLDNLVSVLRARVQLRAKIRSMSSEAKASGRIIAAMPLVVSVLVYLTSPQYIGLLFSEPIGNVVLVCAGLWMLIGVVIMSKMIRFDY